MKRQNPVWVCQNCETEVQGTTAARRHAHEAGPVWHPERQTFVTHTLLKRTT